MSITEEDFSDIYEQKKLEKTKEEILDEKFKKIEYFKKKTFDKNNNNINLNKRIFPKLGFFLIILGIIILICVNNIPWIYIKYSSSDVNIQQLIYKDFKVGNDDAVNIKTNDIFNSPCNNCSNNSRTYIGLTIDDFTNLPKKMIYYCYALIAFGIFFTIYTFIDRYKNYSEKINYIIRLILASGIIIISVNILLDSIKFFSANVLIQYNMNFIKILDIKNINLIFIVPIILFIISILLIIIGIRLIKINLNDIEKKYNITN